MSEQKHCQLTEVLAMSGILPEDYSEFATLVALYVTDNYLTGKLPASWAFSPLDATLQDLRLGSNLLSGTIPEGACMHGSPFPLLIGTALCITGPQY